MQASDWVEQIMHKLANGEITSIEAKQLLEAISKSSELIEVKELRMQVGNLKKVLFELSLENHKN